jgi:hypothetical protein
MTTKTDSALIQRFQSLIDGHANLKSMEANRLTNVLGTLVPGFLAEREKWAELQRKTADDFNLFRVIGVEAKEVIHSKLLAWILDPQIEGGTHAQGNRGLRLFVEEFARELRTSGDDASAHADADFWVDFEVRGQEARVDIEIAAHGKFLIQIENKIYAAEGDDQTNREWRDLQARRKQLGVPESHCHAIFLTLDGSLASNDHFRPVAWSRIARVLDKFADQAEPVEVKLFVRHYAKAIRGLSVAVHEEAEADDGDL